MLPPLAKWMVLWLEANHVSGLRSEHIVAYITRDYTPLVGTAWGAEVEKAAAARVAEEGEATYRHRAAAAASAAPSHGIANMDEFHAACDSFASKFAAYKPPAAGTAAHAQLHLHEMLNVKLRNGELTS